MANKGLVASVIKCLTQLLEQDNLNAESREGLEVAVQCLENAYGVNASDALSNFDIIKLYQEIAGPVKTDYPKVSPEVKLEAERLKNEGNNLLKSEKYLEAVENYTKAIQLDGSNAVYYCNRAAAHSKIGNHQQAIKDCNTALSIDPKYGKAYGRLGVAYSSLNKFKEAKECYQKGLELEPENESFRSNLQIAEEKLAQNGSPGLNLDLGSLLSNPALMTMARQMLSDPSMQSMMNNIMSGGNVEQGGRMEALIQAGQQLAQQMQTANPDLIESLRNQMGGNPNDSDPSQQQ